MFLDNESTMGLGGGIKHETLLGCCFAYSSRLPYSDPLYSSSKHLVPIKFVKLLYILYI